ncbi:histidine phosphatase family protein [Glutamicibacter protophormiae]|uniref:Broad specificity phosphatase PhoE n=1 Tax=Glutamicibacter protophormiae TaxID=37930 RepID=A0ABS4XK99_GLUPR|nr:histidine phosphatase family protein [Glutamicibacter protophormiae]MBP2396933.1 broad specificity phosphatase PhoE [Glutamicibacter protophormiae]WPR63780.1 histidine phosphatase family protein [Glutamicibacter protophormiae]WPR67275.1 histidine phosphatase family protein [Glutamicibacter protophormiae]GGL92864.1 fructose 2,6-bisphosphatase [Glutamicibacter protophormiae]
MPLSTVHLLRHGEVFNPDRILYGRIPGFGLSELGFKMADGAGDYFAKHQSSGGNIVRIVASPLVRAQQTAAPTAQALELPILTDDRVIEAGNKLQGLSKVAQHLKSPRYWPLLVNPLKPSWGEPYAEQVARMREAMDFHRKAALDEHGDGVEIVIVSHQLPIWVTRRSAEGKPLWHDPRKRECTLTSITSFEFDGDEILSVRYTEPSPELLAGAANIPGA